ncbi:RNA methyltransferase [Roseateles sp. BYS180W]|uniref:RNA methyltransferase n=1 Tax=Roseateles rivi TaxID=3299028 RepID=A0ABW7FVK9_9BURK
MYSIAELQTRLHQLGALPAHRDRVLRHWLHNIPLDKGRRALQHFLPLAVREALPELMGELASLARLQEQHPGADGSERLLVGLQDGQSAEAVLLPRGGLCVSSQVGCAVGCRFCMTGQGGLVRQLGSAEILAQLALARQIRPVRKVVFMGMGEPSHNLAAVLEAIELMGTVGQIGHKQLVFSTVGDARIFDQLRQARVRPALALSLHSSNAQRRRELLPRAAPLEPQWLVEEADRYGRDTGYPVQYQWTLIEGVNDSAEEIDGVARLLAGRWGVLNMIPYNSVPALPYQRPDWERCRAIARELHQRGVLTKLRDSAGQDVDGGCGQLRARAQQQALQPIRLLRQG